MYNLKNKGEKLNNMGKHANNVIRMLHGINSKEDADAFINEMYNKDVEIDEEISEEQNLRL